jgi:uncharacterized membrane protein
MSPSSIPVELMELLNKIYNNVNEVKERLAKIEGQDHSQEISNLKKEIDEERKERIKMQIEIATMKTKIAPIIAGVSLFGAIVVEILSHLIHF